MHINLVGNVRRLSLHPLNVLLASETLATDKQCEILGFDALEKSPVVPGLRRAVFVVDRRDLCLVVEKVDKQLRRLNHLHIDGGAAPKQKSQSTSEDNAQNESHQSHKQ